MDIKAIIDWIVDFVRISWELICMAPVASVLTVLLIIIAIPVMKDTQKKIDEAKGPIIFR